MLHAYCVRRSGDPPPGQGLRGLDGVAIRVVREAGLALWVTDSPPARPTAEHLRQHDAVVRHALTTATPLPIRFGAAGLASEAAARETLTTRSGELLAALDRLAGHVEMGVRIAWDAPAVEDAAEPARPALSESPGRAYLEARREALRTRDSLAAAASAALDEVEREMRLDGVPTSRTLLPAPGIAGLLAHLVRRGEVERYARAVAAAREALPEYRLAPSGPWAPYSFS